MTPFRFDLPIKTLQYRKALIEAEPGGRKWRVIDNLIRTVDGQTNRSVLASGCTRPDALSLARVVNYRKLQQ